MNNEKYHEKCLANAMHVWKEYADYERAKLNLLASISRSLARFADAYNSEHGLGGD